MTAWIGPATLTFSNIWLQSVLKRILSDSGRWEWRAKENALIASFISGCQGVILMLPFDLVVVLLNAMVLIHRGDVMQRHLQLSQLVKISERQHSEGPRATTEYSIVSPLKSVTIVSDHIHLCVIELCRTTFLRMWEVINDPNKAKNRSTESDLTKRNWGESCSVVLVGSAITKYQLA